MYKVHHFVRDAGELKLKTSWEPTSKYKAWTNVRLLFLKWIWKPESVCLACLLPPAYSTWCLHQNKTFTLHVVCRVHSSEIHLALSLLPVLTLCHTYGTGRPVQFHRWFSRTLGRWCAFKCVGNWGTDVWLFAKIHRKQQDHWHWCQVGRALVCWRLQTRKIHDKVPLSVQMFAIKNGKGQRTTNNPWKMPLGFPIMASGWQLASNGKTYHRKPVAVHLAFWLLWPHGWSSFIKPCADRMHFVDYIRFVSI